MKISSKNIIYGFVFGIAFAMFFMSRFFGGTNVSVTHDYYADSGYKVGTIAVQEEHSLPVRMTADLDGNLTEVYARKGEFLSEWIPSSVPFHALGISWYEDVRFGTEANIYVRTRKSSGTASEWIHVAKDNDAQSNEEIEGMFEEGKHKYYSFLRTAWSTHIQYKVVVSTENTDFTPVISGIEFTYIDSSRSEAQAFERKDDGSHGDESRENILAGLAIMPSGTNIKIISREDWGANEDLRIFKGLGKPKQIEVSEEIETNFGDEIKLRKEVKKNGEGKLLTWPLQYPAGGIKAIIVHHTASEEGAMEDSYAAMRAIYYYHTVTRGWGDIGYNFLIDEDGRIFEGRNGGDEVVGAHTANYNVGSVGVAIIGNYQENEVNGGAVEGLVKILTHITEKYKLDPTGVVKMRGQNVNVISGHRDEGKTVCPGEYVYEKMPSIRQLVKSELEMRRQQTGFDQTVKALNGIDFDDIDDRGIILLGPEEEKTVTLRLRNTGEKNWSRNTALIYRNGNNNIAGFEETVARIIGESAGRRDVGEFKIPIRGSFASGLKNYYLNLSVGTDVSERQILFPVYIEPADLSFRFVQIDKFTKTTLKKNESAKLVFTLENTGNVSWTENTVSLQSTSPESIFAEGRMISKGVIPPGGKAVFSASFKAGVTAGQFTEQLKLSIIDGKGNKAISKKSQDFNFRVEGIGTLKAGEKVLLTAISEDRILKPGEKVRAWIEVENNSNETWRRAGSDHIYVAALKSPHIKVGNLLIHKGAIKPGETTKIYFDLKAPAKAGQYFVNFIFRNKNFRLTKKQIRFDFEVSNKRDDMIRVLLPFEGAPIITSDSYFSVLDEGINIAGGETMQISYKNNSYILNVGNKKIVSDKYIRINSENGILRIENFSNPPAWNPSLNDNEYRGVLEVREIDGKLQIINELPLEHYLYGIGEVSNTDHGEKIKTIAVLARTYAKYYIEMRGTGDAKFVGKPYDLDSSPDVSQKYIGYGLEKRSPKIKAGVDATRGEVVTYNGKIVKTPYFNATDGTATKSAEEVWGWTDTPYLVSVPDPLCESKEFLGHGVGLSGCGAASAAERGYSYKEIIKYYYKGVEITNLR